MRLSVVCLVLHLHVTIIGSSLTTIYILDDLINVTSRSCLAECSILVDLIDHHSNCCILIDLIDHHLQLRILLRVSLPPNIVLILRSSVFLATARLFRLIKLVILQLVARLVFLIVVGSVLLRQVGAVSRCGA